MEELRGKWVWSPGSSGQKLVDPDAVPLTADGTCTVPLGADIVAMGSACQTYMYKHTEQTQQ